LTERYAVHRTDKLDTAILFADGIGGPIDNVHIASRVKSALIGERLDKVYLQGVVVCN